MHQTELPPSQHPVPEDFRHRSFTWDDPEPAAAAVRHLDGEAFLQAILDGRLPGPPVARALDFRPVSVAPGTVVFEFVPAEFHYNPIGSVHGGVLATLCDSACGCAVQSLLPAGTYYTSLDLSVKFLRPVTCDTGQMMCEGSVTHLGGRSALAQARLTDASGKLFAHATSSCMVFRPPSAPKGTGGGRPPEAAASRGACGGRPPD